MKYEVRLLIEDTADVTPGDSTEEVREVLTEAVEELGFGVIEMHVSALRVRE